VLLTNTLRSCENAGVLVAVTTASRMHKQNEQQRNAAITLTSHPGPPNRGGVPIPPHLPFSTSREPETGDLRQCVMCVGKGSSSIAEAQSDASDLSA